MAPGATVAVRSAFDDTARGLLLDRALGWLLNNVSAFQPPDEPRVVDRSPEWIEPGRRRKAYGELGLALALARRQPLVGTHPAVQALADAWWAAACERQVFFDLRRRVRLLPLRVVYHAVASLLGHPLPEVRAELQAAVDAGHLGRVEASAWQQVDVKYYLDLGGVRHGYPPDAALAERSVVFTPPRLAYATRQDLYGLTHVVFGLTDFGGRTLPGAGPGRLRDLDGYTGVALATCLVAHDWDLVGELLATRRCLRLDVADVDLTAARALAAAQDPAGFVPGRDTVSGQRATTPEEAFFDDYHPTLVALIALACEPTDAT